VDEQSFPLMQGKPRQSLLDDSPLFAGINSLSGSGLLFGRQDGGESVVFSTAGEFSEIANHWSLNRTRGGQNYLRIGRPPVTKWHDITGQPGSI
jgi:hypothetical protein